MNKKIKIFIFIVIFLVIIVLIKKLLLEEYVSNLHALKDRINTDSDFKLKFKIIMLFVYAVFGALFSRIGFVIARKKGLDPWKWAKYCFLFNLWAIFYLVAIEENAKTKIIDKVSPGKKL